jgi:ATP-dependent RNA helicase RhlE
MQDQKLAQLDKMLNEEEGTYLVFSRTKHGADRIGRKLEKLGHATEIIHGDRSQSQRSAALKSFATGRSRVLVATDVAARGIDISNIAHVVNYDLPNGSDDFVHRIGRTGRAGAKGVATTFVTPLEKGDARKLERELKIKFEWHESDKNLAKEERNKPVDFNGSTGGSIDGLLQMETRSWKNADGSVNESADAAPSRPYSGNRGGSSRGGSSFGRGPGGGGRPGGSRPGGHAGRSGGAGRRPGGGNRGR